MTPESIIDGAVEYMPNKTKGELPEIIRVPLNKHALALVEKYKGIDKKGRLFPFISTQKYNDAIKSIFTDCEIKRIVTVVNPKTGEEERRPINEIASSDMARRTFVGNLYKKVKKSVVSSFHLMQPEMPKPVSWRQIYCNIRWQDFLRNL